MKRKDYAGIYHRIELDLGIANYFKVWQLRNTKFNLYYSIPWQNNAYI